MSQSTFALSIYVKFHTIMVAVCVKRHTHPKFQARKLVFLGTCGVSWARKQSMNFPVYVVFVPKNSDLGPGSR